ncbi:MAG: DNA primase [Acidobacteria bacterium]|nr:MAG: DNA primase [Acidobacteriota bacterium]
MRFDDTFIEQVRNGISIVDLVGGYVRLQKKGKDYGALCPFHNEKTPSFTVSEAKQIFYCFGCQAGGDIFKFIMLMENLTFPESIHQLAESQGIPLPHSTKKSEAESVRRQQLLKILEIATHFFSRRLEGKKDALAYLKDRQITQETIHQFSIGYAPAGQNLLQELTGQGFDVKDVLACGLIKEGNSGGYYDNFRNRIMFPIHNLSGKTIAFGGRILGDGIPKYLNSPETPLYSKSRNLYPLDLTRNEIRKRDFAIIVEGYFDCIIPFHFGIRNVVASLGTSLTESQVKVLGRYTRNVITNYDPDSAGTAATLRSIDLFLEQGFRVNVLQLPSGEDPDVFLRKQGTEAYREKLKSSQSYLDFVLSQFMSQQRDPFSPKGKQEVVSHILPYLVKIPNPIERAEYVTRIASRLQLDESLLRLEMRKMPARKRETPRFDYSVPVEQGTRAENILLVAMLEEQWAASTFEQLEPELFEGLRTERIFQGIFQLKEQATEITTIRLREIISEGTDRNLIEEMALRSADFPLSEEDIRSSVQELRRMKDERLIRQLQEEIKAEEKEHSDSDKIKELLDQKQNLRRKMVKEQEEALTSSRRLP